MLIPFLVKLSVTLIAYVVLTLFYVKLLPTNVKYYSPIHIRPITIHDLDEGCNYYQIEHFYSEYVRLSEEYFCNMRKIEAIKNKSDLLIIFSVTYVLLFSYITEKIIVNCFFKEINILLFGFLFVAVISFLSVILIVIYKLYSNYSKNNKFENYSTKEELEYAFTKYNGSFIKSFPVSLKNQNNIFNLYDHSKYISSYLSYLQEIRIYRIVFFCIMLIICISIFK